MQLIYARYNKYYNSIDITTFNGYLLEMQAWVDAEDSIEVW